MNTITTILCAMGVYCILQPIWEWLEKLELGNANTTLVDTVICYGISLVIARFLVDLEL